MAKEALLNFNNIYRPVRYKYMTTWAVTITAFGKIKKRKIGFFFPGSRSAEELKINRSFN